MNFSTPSAILFGVLVAAVPLFPVHADPDPVADAAPRSINLTGMTTYDEWTPSGLSSAANPGFPSFPGTGAWPNPIGSNLGGDGLLSKITNGIGGGAYPAGASIYYGGFSSTVNNPGGTLAVSKTGIDFDVNTVVFQIEIGEVWNYDFFDGLMPTFSYNGGSQNIVPDFTTLVVQAYNGTIETPNGPEAVYINLWGLQWDLSGISEPVTSYSISWVGVQHAQIHGLRLDASSDIYSSSVFTTVPEPTAFAAVTVALVAGLAVARARNRRR